MSLKSDSATPIDQEGRRISYTGVEVYVEILDTLHTWMRANGMSMVLKDDIRHLPMTPSPEILHRVDNGNARTKEKREVQMWIKECKDWETLMLRGIDAFTKILTPNMRVYLRDQGKDLTEGTRANYHDLEDTIRQRYASWTDDT